MLYTALNYFVYIENKKFPKRITQHELKLMNLNHQYNINCIMKFNKILLESFKFQGKSTTCTHIL